MKTFKTKKIIAITFLLLVFVNSNFVFSAEENAPKGGPMKRREGFHISAGAGVAMKNNIRKNNLHNGLHADLIFKPIPLVQFSWGPVSLGAQGLSLSMNESYSFGGFINLNREGDKYDGLGMEQRKESLFLGGGVRYKKFLLSFAKDIGEKSRGSKISFSYARMFFLGPKLLARASVGVDCYSKSYADYYFGVKATEALTDRPEYHPKAYCNPGLAFLPIYRLNEDVNLISGMSIKILSSQIRKSPTTTGTWIESALFAGALYQF